MDEGMILLVIISLLGVGLIITLAGEEIKRKRKHRKMQNEAPNTYKILQALFPGEFGRR